MRQKAEEGHHRRADGKEAAVVGEELPLDDVLATRRAQMDDLMATSAVGAQDEMMVDIDLVGLGNKPQPGDRTEEHSRVGT